MLIDEISQVVSQVYNSTVVGDYQLSTMLECQTKLIRSHSSLDFVAIC